MLDIVKLPEGNVIALSILANSDLAAGLHVSMSLLPQDDGALSSSTMAPDEASSH